MLRKAATAVFLLNLFFAPLAMAQAFGQNAPKVAINPDPLEITSVELNPKNFKLGGVAELRVGMRLPPEYHAYLDQFKIEVETPTDVYLSEFQVEPIVDFKDPVSKKIKKGTQGSSELVTLVQLPSKFKLGKSRVNAILTYQACGKDFCLFPTRKNFSFDMVVEGDAAPGFVERNLEKGWLMALLVVFLSGILTSFTPCIFPLIPITLAVIGSTDTRGSRWKGFVISLSYVVGIAVTYSLLGLVAAKTGALFGGFLGHPVVVGFIALVFILMGLSMYGLFETKIPDKWTTALMGRRWEKGLLGAFLSGLIAGVVASPCVGPVLVSLLAYVAHSQNTMQGTVFLFVFALGLGQVFLVLGTFSQLIYKLPKSGPWLENVKFVFGTIMIAAAFYFLYPVTPPGVFEAIVGITLILIGIFFGGFQKTNLLKHATPMVRTSMRLLIALGILFSVTSILPKEWQSQFFFNASTQLPSYENPQWFPYSDATLKKAQTEKRPVVLDFKAEWCLACKELEIKTFSDPRVIGFNDKILWLAFDATHSSPELDELKSRYGIQGLPTVLFFDQQGNYRPDLTLTGFEEADEFLQRLRQL